MKNYLQLLSVCFAFTFTSCSKDDDDDKKPKPAPTRTELLTAKSWVMTASTVNPVNSPGNVTDLYSPMDSCRKDNIFTFSPDSTLVIDEGALKRNLNDLQIRFRKWALVQNETKLREVLPNGQINMEPDIISLTSTELILGGVQQDSNGSNFYKATYTSQ